MNFVDDVDFILPFARGDDSLFAEFADVIYASVRGGVDFDDVEIIVFKLVRKAIDFVSQDACDGSLAGAARTNEKISVRKLAIRDGFCEHGSDLLLSNYLT